MQSLSPLRSALGSISASFPHGTFKSISRHASSSGCLERLGGSFWFIHNVARGENARHASLFSGNFGTSFGLLTSKEDVTVPYALSFQSFIHSTGQNDFETGRDSNPVDFAAGREDVEMERSSMQNSNLGMGRNPSSMNFSAGRRDFEMGRSSMQNSNLDMGRSSRAMNFSAGQRDFEMERNPRPMDFYAGGRNSRPMDFVRGVVEQEGSRFPQYHVELNDDFVFMKLKRNNTFVAVTDSKGNKKEKMLQ
ncbi:RIBOSOMAL PROTEIN S11 MITOCHONDRIAL-RELATED [Salix purpurea]|uniref:RIBOSOMAL PROTEIN S11 MITOCHONDRIAL-RELATED n=1 Tax=Salix purpurea TaxID=77065 RepID=A0A9Q0V2U1_SALPP|nr:RIBOSOMAL PROTEIN S11 MITOCHONDRIAL-RELATED [Salix purpurea]